MHMKIEINHPENISPAPRNLSNPLNKLNTTVMIPKKSQTLSKASPHLQKNLNPSRKNLNLPEKLPLPKNSITITETISNTRTKSQPLPEKSQPLVKNSQFLLKKSQPPTPYPLKFFQPSLKISSHSMKIHSMKISHATTLKICQSH